MRRIDWSCTYVPKVRWDLRIVEPIGDWVDAYAEERGVSRTQVVELALKELKGVAATGVLEIEQKPIYRPQASRVRRCFVCTGKDCITRVFLNPSDPEGWVPECPDHGSMVRDRNRPYRGQPTPV